MKCLLCEREIVPGIDGPGAGIWGKFHYVGCWRDRKDECRAIVAKIIAALKVSS